MPQLPIIEIYHNGTWLPAATIEPLGNEHARVEYLPTYVFDQTNPWPISLTFPVELGHFIDNGAMPRMPAFLYDLVPQGRGRKLLTQLLNLTDQETLALPLLLAGAFNPIGALRVDQAVRFHAEYIESQALPEPSARGFRLESLTGRNQQAIDFLATHDMLSAGTTGVQGAAPKFLLTGDADGLLYPDLALPDNQAHTHWLIKGPRGSSRDDHLILENEASYLHIAAACGLHVHQAEQIKLDGHWLIVPRFDRLVTAKGVERLAQESLASLAGLQGFGQRTSLNHLLTALRQHSDAPEQDTLEFLKRDVLNLALRNTDNHARNHAIQRRADGKLRLTPLFDFAPMFRDPELIPRSLHWVDSNGKNLRNWADILPALGLPDEETHQLSSELARFAETVGRLPEIARDYGTAREIIEACVQTIETQAEQLSQLN